MTLENVPISSIGKCLSSLFDPFGSKDSDLVITDKYEKLTGTANGSWLQVHVPVVSSLTSLLVCPFISNLLKSENVIWSSFAPQLFNPSTHILSSSLVPVLDPSKSSRSSYDIKLRMKQKKVRILWHK